MLAMFFLACYASCVPVLPPATLRFTGCFQTRITWQQGEITSIFYLWITLFVGGGDAIQQIYLYVEDHI